MGQLPARIYSYEDSLTRVQQQEYRGRQLIEPGVQSLIAAFLMFGVTAFNSCEGFTGDPARAYPWVDFPRDQYAHASALVLAAGIADWEWEPRPDSPYFRLKPVSVSAPLQEMRAQVASLAERIRSLAQ